MNDNHESAPLQPPNDENARDVEDMRRAAAGQTAAFEAIILRHQTHVVNFFVRMGVFSNAEDLAQETFIRLWNYRLKYEPKAKFVTFLYTLARHAALDWFRRRKRFALFSDRYAHEMPSSTDGGIGRAHKQMDIQSGLSSLPEKQRACLVLAIYQGLNYEEISHILNIPLGTVKSRIFSALVYLKKEFRHED